MEFLKRACFSAAIALLAPTLTAASERRVALTVEAVAVPANGPIVLDGKLNEEVWQELSGVKRYVFGRIDQTTVSINTRFNYTLTPNLSLQVDAEPFVSAGDYSNFKELVDGRAATYGDRYRPYAYASNPDFNYRSFRTTNVLRWEYKPGSALFVCSSKESPLVKFSYWLNM